MGAYGLVDRRIVLVSLGFGLAPCGVCSAGYHYYVFWHRCLGDRVYDVDWTDSERYFAEHRFCDFFRSALVRAAREVAENFRRQFHS